MVFVQLLYSSREKEETNKTPNRNGKDDGSIANGASNRRVYLYALAYRRKRRRR